MAPLIDVENARPPMGRDTEVSLLDVAAALARRKLLITGVTLGALIVAAAIAFLIPPTYTAEAVILPPQLEQSPPMMQPGALASLGGTGALGAVAGATGFWRNPADLYIGVLKSRTIADALIERFQLSSVYGYKTMADTREKLAQRSSITSGKDQLIRLRIEDRDRERAAKLANAYTDELLKLTSRLAFTSATRRRQFFEQELAAEKHLLADAEVALRNTQQSSGLVAPSGQSEALIRAGAQLRAEVASREVQLEAMRVYATAENPQVQLLERETAALRGQLEKLRAGGGAQDDFMPPTNKLPAASLEYLRKLRDLKYHETLFELLAKQYEAARIDEARSAPLIQVVDQATPPDKKSWPPRTLIVLAIGMLAALTACFFVLIRSRRVEKP
ncbi:MAG TPA: Wzz/FepE/Etk N-terminal domain-containing protein [Bryobacteraceae bacterium]|nr:Wzz/FepE/Etk N-terminal domain-containing protein [Bryobacteraceae bacterium]